MSENRPTGRFQPGVSGNPGGKPSELAAFRKQLAEFDPLAMQAIRRVLSSDDDKVVVQALALFWDRRYGKAPQAITGEDGKPLRLEIGIVDVLRKMVELEPAKVDE